MTDDPPGCLPRLPPNTFREPTLVVTYRLPKGPVRTQAPPHKAMRRSGGTSIEFLQDFKNISQENVEWTCLDLPQCKTEDFRTLFQPRHGPGFFPGAGGYFHGCSPGASRRIVFFGTDFGTENYWETEVTEGRGEKRTQRTLCNLRCLIEEAGVDPCSCYLTNAVLALAKGDDMTGNDRIYKRKRYRNYLEECGEFHQTWISRHKPDIAVLMGTQNVDSYRRLIFNRVFPTLEDEWAGFRAPWMSIYDAKKELVRTRRGEPDVLWMFHPSYRQSNPQFPELKSQAEKKRRREEIWARTAQHLKSYA